MTTTRRSWLARLAYAAICIIWGTTYYAIFAALQGGLPPFVLGAMRYALAGLLILIISMVRKEAQFNRGFICSHLLIGIVMMGGGQAIIFWAQQYIASGYAAILEASLPLWFVVLDGRIRATLFRNKMIVAGLILGFLGILLLFFNHLGAGARGIGTMAIIGALVVIASCIFWALASLYTVKKFHDTPLLAGLVWQIFGGLIFCLIMSGILSEWKQFEPVRVTARAWQGAGYLAIAGSVIALMAYHWLLKQWPSAVVGTYAYINPVVAVVIGYFAANEELGVFEFSGMIAILFAAWMVNKGREQLAANEASFKKVM